MATSSSNPTASTATGPLITRAVIALLYLAVAAAGALYGWGFGVRIGGSVLTGAMTGLMCALFCTILLGAGIDRLLAWMRSERS